MKRTKVVFIVVTSILCSLLLLSACSKNKDEFNFIFSYGVYNKNELNTFTNKYTKDLVNDGTVTTKLTLTKEEKEKIFNCMTEIRIKDYQGINHGLEFEPESGYSLEIQLKEEGIKVIWKGGFKDEQKDENFKKLTTLIQGIIESHDEYKKLPNANGGYL
ncbi:hypothetical protein [Cohnella silvisoli]|uniref:Lipoprotein n=1 Tax=Cohnella silvisoli TaxID=2873699 RepID=A0ABV1KM17_9BACL|nr:hypothetical protein [Cohnella silvisoli]MCD9020571.1 hypothetical protein [Cohnella silvisoli]